MEKSCIRCVVVIFLLLASGCIEVPTSYPTLEPSKILSPTFEITSTPSLTSAPTLPTPIQQTLTPTLLPTWHTEKYLMCDRINISMLNESGKRLDTEKQLVDKDGNIIGKDNAPVEPEGYANIGADTPLEYVGKISWVIHLYDPETRIELARFEGEDDSLDCSKINNFVKNGDFSQGKEFWEQYGNGFGEYSIKNGEYCVNITSPGTGPEGIVIGQKDIRLNTGKPYTFRFDIRAEPEKFIDYRVTYPSYEPVLFDKVNLQKEKQSFGGMFIVNGNENDAIVYIEIRVGGSSTGFVCISNVVITEE